MASMAAIIALVTLSTFTALAADPPRVLSMPISQLKTAPYHALSERDAVPVDLQNHLPSMRYYVTADVGTPGQEQRFLLDTGASDIWTFAPNVCESAPQKSNIYIESCSGKSFNSSQSSSYRLRYPDEADFQYYSRQFACGDYFTDNLQIGDVIVHNLTMALIEYSGDHFSGIMGIGPPTGQSPGRTLTGTSSSCAKEFGDTTVGPPDPLQRRDSLLEKLYREGVINGLGFSVHLNDQAAPSGTLLLGGVDRAKYVGDLISVPVLPETLFEDLPELKVILHWQVEWSSVGLTDGLGSKLLEIGDFPGSATLDTGAPGIQVPNAVYDQLSRYFGVRDDDIFDRSYPEWPLINCTPVPSIGTLDFQFGGAAGPMIAVPFSELVLPLYQGEEPIRFDDGSEACQFAVEPVDVLQYKLDQMRGRADKDIVSLQLSVQISQKSSGLYLPLVLQMKASQNVHHPRQSRVGNPNALVPYILGAPFLRSAYAVFDIANGQIALAQANNSAGDTSDVQEIGGSRLADPTNIPGVQTTVHEAFTPPPPRPTFDFVEELVSLGESVEANKPYSEFSSLTSLFMDAATRSFGSIKGSLGPPPTARSTTAVDGVPTTYTQAAVTSLMDKPGRVAVSNELKSPMSEPVATGPHVSKRSSEWRG